jgi:hypothetical protein
MALPRRRGYSERMDETSRKTEVVFLVEEAAEGGYTARGLEQAIFTEADTLDALRDAVRDAVRCHFEPGTEPRIIRLHVVRDEVLTT